MAKEVWVGMEHRESEIENTVFGILAEAENWRSQQEEQYEIVIVALGSGLREEVDRLELGLADRVIICEDPQLKHFQGER